MRPILLLVLVVLPTVFFGQTPYQKAWKSIREKDWKQAESFLREGMQDPAQSKDCYITSLYLKNYRGQDDRVSTYADFYKKTSDPFPYTYALWFETAVIGNSGKKQREEQVALLNTILDDPRAPGTMVAASNYQLGLHYLYSAKQDKMSTYFNQVNSIHGWQFAGPFENLSQSGFYKDYGPIAHPEADAVFASLTDAPVKWFVPAKEILEGWSPVSYSFGEQTAVVYAQTFIQSEKDQDLVCNLGVSGAVKLWINDQLLITEPEERTTELDAYRVKCQLKKGGNRVLIQLSFTGNTFANFAVRFTDDKGFAVKGIAGSPAVMAYPRSAAGTARIPEEELMAEKFFRSAIQEDPSNLVNYLLLTDTYLRNKKIIEARNLMTAALEKEPDNCLLIMKEIEVILKEDNRTLLLEEVDKIRQLDPESLVVLELNIRDFYKDEKYDDCRNELAKRIKLYGEDETTARYELQLLTAEKKYDDLVKEVERQYKIYPSNESVVSMMYAVKSEVYKDKKGAMKTYEDYFRNNYNYTALNTYKQLLEQQGQHDKARAITDQMKKDFDYAPQEFYKSSVEYFKEKDYDNAQKDLEKAIAIAPYVDSYWEQMGDIHAEKKRNAEAMAAYRESLRYNPNQYEVINKIRKLDNRQELHKLVFEASIDSVVKADKISEAKNTDYGWYYILDQKDILSYPGGACEQYYTTLIRITNEKGIDQYKESSIGYGSGQSLLIEKAEIIKTNMTHIRGEVNDNQVVFTKLEAGDVVVFRYRVRDYYYGRMSRELWDQYYFGGQIYSARVRFNVVIPAATKLYYDFQKSDLKPVVTDLEDFKQYTWEAVGAEPDKDESLLPNLSDISAVLHVSTVPSWKQVSDWYADIANNRAEEDFEIIDLYKSLFPAGTMAGSDVAKARKIYDYIESNIRYSSVAFRQNGYVPQRPAKTLTTRLGDCKDLSSLFVTLARMAGIKAQMVLVDTRDNGENHLILPSMEFNHCIAKADLDDKTYYIELTDNNLPFASLPNEDLAASMLEIPYRTAQEQVMLKKLNPVTRSKDQFRRTMEITPKGADLEITVKNVISGAPSAGTRNTYKELDQEKRLKQLQESVAGRYKNVVNVSSVDFGPLDTRDDSVKYTYKFKVKNEISEIGSMNAFRITYPDVVASLDNFSEETRTFPINYMGYEDVDSYETIVTINAPAGSTFIELPKAQSLSFKKMTFSISYAVKGPGKLVVTRRFLSTRETLPAADYVGLKAFFEKIVKAEQVFITYK